MWALLEDDGYILDHLCEHMILAGETDMARTQLLFNMDWCDYHAVCTLCRPAWHFCGVGHIFHPVWTLCSRVFCEQDATPLGLWRPAETGR